MSSAGPPAIERHGADSHDGLTAVRNGLRHGLDDEPARTSGSTTTARLALMHSSSRGGESVAGGIVARRRASPGRIAPFPSPRAKSSCRSVQSPRSTAVPRSPTGPKRMIHRPHEGHRAGDAAGAGGMGSRTPPARVTTRLRPEWERLQGDGTESAVVGGPSPRPPPCHPPVAGTARMRMTHEP